MFPWASRAITSTPYYREKRCAVGSCSANRALNRGSGYGRDRFKFKWEWGEGVGGIPAWQREQHWVTHVKVSTGRGSSAERNLLQWRFKQVPGEPPLPHFLCSPLLPVKQKTGRNILFYHSAAFWKHAVKNIQAQDTSKLFVKPSSSRSGRSSWGGQPSKSQPSQPLPLDATYLPKSRAALTPRFLSCMPSGGQCAHHRLRRFRSPLPESRGQGAGWPSANPPPL